MKPRGRPRVSTLSRKEQLRRAKSAERARQRKSGIVNVQLTVPKQTAEKLAVARRTTEFAALLDRVLDQAVVRIADYSELKDLAWNRADELIPAKEAFQLYERNWRFIDLAHLDARERELIERLKIEFGNGEINA